MELRYVFRFDDGEEAVLTVSTDGGGAGASAGEHAAWTALAFQQCPNCPLLPEEHPRCPAAVSVEEAIRRFGDIISYEEATVRIETAARTYSKRTSVQEAVSSLLGLTLAASGCPILAKLRPMGRYHLPFSTMDETQYRVLSMYLLAQYFKAQAGERPDWDLRDLGALYEEIRAVNEAFARRLSCAEREDTSRNALALLDSFAMMVRFTLDRRKLDELRALFAPHLGPPAGDGRAGR